MKRIFILSAALVIWAGFAPAQQKKRVAVMNFDYATVQTGVPAIFGSNQDVGKGIADMLVDKLVNDGTYSVIERKMLDKILAEQNFSNSDRADPNSRGQDRQAAGCRRHHRRQHHAVRARRQEDQRRRRRDRRHHGTLRRGRSVARANPRPWWR